MKVPKCELVSSAIFPPANVALEIVIPIHCTTMYWKLNALLHKWRVLEHEASCCAVYAS